MGPLLFLLLLGLHKVSGSSEHLQRSFPFHGLQISSFVSSSQARTDCLAWLGELQTHSWSNDSDSIRFLKPWSQGTFSLQQWEQVQNELWVYRLSFTRDIQDFVKLLKLTYPIELQVFAGCEMHPGNASESFFHVAYQGMHVLSFRGTLWEAAPGTPPFVKLVVKELNLDHGTREMIQELLNNTCPQFVSGLIEAGRSELEKQVKPEAWLSSGPSPGPGRLLLVCRVSGFYPKPVQVMWMRGDQKQPHTRQGDFLPNADGTWYLRVTLDVAAGDAAGLSCRVKHSSLGGQDIVLYWAGSHTSVYLIVVLVVLALLGLGAGLIFWFRRRCSYQGIL